MNKNRFYFFKRALCTVFVFVFLFPLTACQNAKIDYFDYVSEYRENVFLGESDGVSVKIFATKRESPYLADGFCAQVFDRTELRVYGLSGEMQTQVVFRVSGKEYGGELSFDNTTGEYFFNCTLFCADEREIPVVITRGEENVLLNAVSQKSDGVITGKQAIEKLVAIEKERFSALTKSGRFLGEIYIRYIHENAPYYFVGVIDRNGAMNAYLLHGETGKILATRRSDAT